MKILGQDFTAKETAEIILKGIASELPLGGLLASVYSDWQNKVQYTNVLDILAKFEERLNKVESQIDDNFYGSKEYFSLLISVALKGQNELNEEKRIVYAEYLTACCLTKNRRDDYISFLDIVSRVNKLQLMILKSAYDEIPLSHSWGSGNLNSITSAINHEGYSITPYRVERELDYLISLSMISKIDVKGIGKLLAAIGFNKDVPNFIGSNDVYYRTNMGNSIISFLETAPKNT